MPTREVFILSHPCRMLERSGAASINHFFKSYSGARPRKGSRDFDFRSKSRPGGVPTTADMAILTCHIRAAVARLYVDTAVDGYARSFHALRSIDCTPIDVYPIGSIRSGLWSDTQRVEEKIASQESPSTIYDTVLGTY